jgi:hypothetical protein
MLCRLLLIAIFAFLPYTKAISSDKGIDVDLPQLQANASMSFMFLYGSFTAFSFPTSIEITGTSISSLDLSTFLLEKGSYFVTFTASLSSTFSSSSKAYEFGFQLRKPKDSDDTEILFLNSASAGGGSNDVRFVTIQGIIHVEKPVELQAVGKSTIGASQVLRDSALSIIKIR